MSGWGGTLPARSAIEKVAALGYREVQIDAARPGLRGRELDRSARKDITSLLRRLGLRLSGLDLWIPPSHFSDRALQQRAVDAVLDAIELAADLRAGGGEPVVSIRVAPETQADAIAPIISASEKHGIAVADHDPESHSALRCGIDPAEVYRAGIDLIKHITAKPISSARLSDWNGSRRVLPGSRLGKLDPVAYRAILDVVGYRAPVIVDLRDTDATESAAKEVFDLWGG